MKYNTRDFGELDICENDILSFAQPLFGFENYKQFAIISNKDIGDSFAWLQSLEEPSICFILFDPSPFSDYFSPKLPQNISDIIGEGEYICWVLCTIPNDFSKTTVNLKSPIIINTNTNKAAQTMLEQDYPVRFPLMQGGK